MILAVPDLISNSYFPAIAAVELGFFRDEGHNVVLELVAPVERAYALLREGTIDFVGGSSHSALAAFPRWQGVKLLCAQGQGMYWFLVMRADLGARRGEIDIVKGKRIGAAPWVGMAFRHLLTQAGIDPAADKVAIESMPATVGANVNFGVAAARALKSREIDGFWANGMGAEIATRGGDGTVVLDVRRGDGPAGCFDYTMASIATTEKLIEQEPDAAAAAVRAVARAQRVLRADPTRAFDIARDIFPPDEAELIVELVRRDLPLYSPAISERTVTEMNRFARAVGILDAPVSFRDVVATQFTPLWNE